MAQVSATLAALTALKTVTELSKGSHAQLYVKWESRSSSTAPEAVVGSGASERRGAISPCWMSMMNEDINTMGNAARTLTL
ncbi:hypothetical protein BJ912DRAFT_1060619 [Pholiota molesta]|nr:hypothetical protein BJ912DRAFT_1060619 [Pholiota molesta]